MLRTPFGERHEARHVPLRSNYDRGTRDRARSRDPRRVRVCARRPRDRGGGARHRGGAGGYSDVAGARVRARGTRCARRGAGRNRCGSLAT